MPENRSLSQIEMQCLNEAGAIIKSLRANKVAPPYSDGIDDNAWGALLGHLAVRKFDQCVLENHSHALPQKSVHR